jgi:GNAT superfamily N-acetyltransferase
MLSIVQATIKDISSIQHIAAVTWPVAYSKIISQGQLDYMMNMIYSTTALEEQMNNGDVFYMANFNGQAIGFASVSKENDAVFKLNKLYVLPNIQGTGAGKSLLQQSIEHAKQNGGKQLHLQVNRANKAKAFYEKNNFKVLYEADFDIGNGYFMNDYVMSLDL